MAQTAHVYPTGPVALALLGNPGAGKSTILNGIAGSPVFESGVSYGTGMTKTVLYHQTGTYLLCDTPGLADISQQMEAGREVDQLLATSFPIKIAFVVTLDRARVRPQDAKTIDIVLSAISGIQKNDSFGVIVNQVTPAVRKRLQEDPDGFSNIRRSLLSHRRTSHWCVVGVNPDLQDRNGGMLLTPEISRFVKQLPVTKPTDATVHRLKISRMPLSIQPKQWIWADAQVKIKVPRHATIMWANRDWKNTEIYGVRGPVALVLELKWVWTNVELLATES